MSLCHWTYFNSLLYSSGLLSLNPPKQSGQRGPYNLLSCGPDSLTALVERYVVLVEYMGK